MAVPTPSPEGWGQWVFICLAPVSEVHSPSMSPNAIVKTTNMSPQGFPLIISDYRLQKSQPVFTSLSIKEGDVNCIIALPTPSEMGE